MPTSKNVVFFGTETFSTPSLEALIAAGYTISYVITKPDAPRGRSKEPVSPQVKQLAAMHSIPVLQPERLADITSLLSELSDPVGVLVAYGKIVPVEIIELFKPGIINLHPSLLPKYRGPSPIESAILNGDSVTGLSLMQLQREMDAGPVYTQLQFTLSGTESKPELYSKYAKRGATLLIDTLPSILSGERIAQTQDESQATYCPLLKKTDGIIDPAQKTAHQIEREVRAYLGYPKSRLIYRQKDIIVLKSRVVLTPNEAPLTISCKDTTYLAIEELVAPSGKKMNAEAFIRGYSL